MLTSLLDGRVFADRHGHGPVKVVALHGWARTSGDWRHILDGMDALAIDLPGFGLSPEPNDVWGSPEYAHQLIEILNDCSKPAILLGHSFGGRVAVQVAAERPDLVKAIILTGAPLVRLSLPKKPSRAVRMVKLLRRARLIPESVSISFRNKRGSTDYRNATSEIMRGVIVRTVNEDYTFALRKITCPTHLIWGADDQAVPVAVGRKLAEIIANASFESVEDAGHLLNGPLECAIRKHLKEILDGAVQ